MRGRRPLPTAVKTLRGNPGKRRLPRREPEPLAGLPPCPRHLRGGAREAWRVIGAELLLLRVVTKADATALELAASAYAEYRRAQGVLERRGCTYVTRSKRGSVLVCRRPEVGIAADAWRRLRLMLIEFGLTPAARTRVPIAEDGHDEQAKDRFFGLRLAP